MIISKINPVINFNSKVIDFNEAKSRKKTGDIFSQNNTVPDNLKNDYAVKVLTSDVNGQTDRSILCKYLSLYKDEKNFLINRYNQELDFYNNALKQVNEDILNNTNSKNCLKDTNDVFSHLHNNNLDFMNSLLDCADNETKKIILEEVIALTKDDYKDIEDYAHLRVRRLFQLSRTDKGYDFSDIKSKDKIIDIIDEVTLEHSEISENKLYETVADIIRSRSGNIDYNAIEHAFYLALEMDMLDSIYDILELLKK